nr:type II secretion system F family protein [Pantoea sp. 201603H]
MILFYLLICAAGILISVSILFHSRRVSHDRRIIEHTEVIDGKKNITAIDYHSLIVSNSPYLTVLRKIDNDLLMKMKIVGVILIFMLVTNWLSGSDFSLRALSLTTLILFVLVIVIPSLLLGPGIKRKAKEMMDVLPYFIELVAVCIQSGMTVESALKFVSERFWHLNPDLSALMGLLVKRAEIGGLEESLHELYNSMEMTELRMFCSTLQQSVHYGTSLYEHLMDLSLDIRDLQLLNTEEKIGSLSAKMSIPLIIFIMFPITVLIAAPGILRIVKNGLF